MTNPREVTIPPGVAGRPPRAFPTGASALALTLCVAVAGRAQCSGSYSSAPVSDSSLFAFFPVHSTDERYGGTRTVHQQCENPATPFTEAQSFFESELELDTQLYREISHRSYPGWTDGHYRGATYFDNLGDRAQLVMEHELDYRYSIAPAIYNHHWLDGSAAYDVWVCAPSGAIVEASIHHRQTVTNEQLEGPPIGAASASANVFGHGLTQSTQRVIQVETTLRRTIEGRAYSYVGRVTSSVAYHGARTCISLCTRTRAHCSADQITKIQLRIFPPFQIQPDQGPGTGCFPDMHLEASSLLDGRVCYSGRWDLLLLADLGADWRQRLAAFPGRPVVIFFASSDNTPLLDILPGCRISSYIGRPASWLPLDARLVDRRRVDTMVRGVDPARLYRSTHYLQAFLLDGLGQAIGGSDSLAIETIRSL